MPLPVEKQVLIIYAGTTGLLDDLPVSSLKAFEEDLYKFVEQKHPDIFKEIIDKKTLGDDLKARMTKAVEAFKKKFTVGVEEAEAKPKGKAKAKDVEAAEE